MPQVATILPDARTIDTIKTSLIRLCAQFLDEELTERAFVARTRTIMQGHGSYNLSLLLKRLEKSCGKHICGFWNECQQQCQYIDSSISWEVDVAMFNPLDMSTFYSKTTSSSSGGNNLHAGQIRQNKNDIEQLKQQLQQAEQVITQLANEVQVAKRERQALRQDVDVLQNQMIQLYEKPYSPSPTLSNQLIPFHNIPIVDMNQPLARLAAEINRVCREVGFMYVVNHGLPLHLMKGAFENAKQFFNLPLIEKQKLSISKSKSGIRGYFKLGEEDLNYKDSTRDLETEETENKTHRGDYKEGFDCGREIEANDSDLKCPLVEPNIWPEEAVLPGFQQGIMEYQNALLSVADTLLVAFAVGLGLERDFFLEMYS